VDAWKTMLVKSKRPALARNVTQSGIGKHMADGVSSLELAIVAVVIVTNLGESSNGTAAFLIDSCR
jgi:hypothetical protein